MTTHASFVVAPSGYQLPAQITLGHVTLQIAELSRSIAYYERVLGLRVIDRSARHASLGAIGASEPLVVLHEKRGVAPVPPRGRIGLYHFAILVPSRESLGQFLAHIGQTNEYAGMSDHLVSEALYLTDPDGLGIEVYADRPRSSWRVDGSAVAMATDPLNVRELIAVGGNVQWTGMPLGSRIGHVHLYVDALEKSEAFFHAALGFDKVSLKFPGALFLSAGGYHHHLGTNIWAAKSPNASDDDARLLEWKVIVPTYGDVQAVMRSLQAAGYPATLDATGIMVTDPWGTQLRVERAM